MFAPRIQDAESGSCERLVDNPKIETIRVHNVEVPRIDGSPSEKVTWWIKMGFLSTIIVLLIIALSVKYIEKDSTHPLNNNKDPNNNKNNKQIQFNPPTFTANNIITNVNNQNIFYALAPPYLSNIFSKLHQFTSKYLDINKSINTEFLYKYGDWFNMTNQKACFNQTINDLTNNYLGSQLFLINLLFPNDDNNDLVDMLTVLPSTQIYGDYGGGFQINCNGHILLSAVAGSSFIDQRYSLFDVEDLTDMNIGNIQDKLVQKGEGKIFLIMDNIYYVREKYKSLLDTLSAMNNNVISIGGNWNQTITENDAYDRLSDKSHEMFDKCLKIMIEEMKICYHDNYPVNELIVGLFMSSEGNGNALSQCNYDDILGNAFFYDFFVSNW